MIQSVVAAAVAAGAAAWATRELTRSQLLRATNVATLRALLCGCVDSARAAEAGSDQGRTALLAARSVGHALEGRKACTAVDRVGLIQVCTHSSH